MKVLSKEKKKTLKGRKIKARERVPDDSDDDITPASSVEHRHSTRSDSRSLSRSPTPAIMTSPTRSRAPSRSPTPAIVTSFTRSRTPRRSPTPPIMRTPARSRTPSRSPTPPLLEDDHQDLDSEEREQRRDTIEEGEIGVSEDHEPVDIARDTEDQRLLMRNPFHDAETDDSLSVGSSKESGNASQFESFSEDNLNVLFASNVSDCSVHCEDCGVSSETLDGPWVQLKDYEQLYACRKCHQEGLSRQEARELDDLDSNLSRTSDHSQNINMCC